MRTAGSIFSLFLLVAGCEVFIYDVGKEGKPCFGNGTCEKGLYCCDGVCRAQECPSNDGEDGRDGEDGAGGDVVDAGDGADAAKQCTSSKDCDDDNVCTNDICDPNTHSCAYVPFRYETSCTDNLDNDCDGQTDSQDTDDCKECTTNSQCDDSNECTIDLCVSGFCQHTPGSDRPQPDGGLPDAGWDGGDDGWDGGDDGWDGGDDGHCLRPPETPRPLSPHNGAYTGSLHDPTKKPLKPKFRWLPTPEDGCGPVTYDLQVDDSCSTAGFSNCTFSSPEINQSAIPGNSFTPTATMELAVSQTPPVGRRYYWRVRACRQDECSPWSDVRYVNVGRLSDDFNGDGYSDVVVGALYQSAGVLNEGNAFVYYGSSGGIPASPSVSSSFPDKQVEKELE